MRKFLKQTGYLLLIIILLPYIITVFVNGKGAFIEAGSTSPYVTVKQGDQTKQMPLSEYAVGVLAREISAISNEQTIKAQAVLIRTSIYKTIEEKGSSAVLAKDYWSRDQMEENWGAAKYGDNYEKMKRAWDDTEGKVLMYNEVLALTPYHKLSNGKTRAGNEVFGEEYPYLLVKECPEDLESKDAMTTTLIQGSDMEVTKTDSAGYVTEVRSGQETVSGEEFRETYHLPSASFTLQPYEKQIRVTSAGMGHGLGMSQFTAEKMAKEGKKYEEILQFFFEGTTLAEVADIVIQ